MAKARPWFNLDPELPLLLRQASFQRRHPAAAAARRSQQNAMLLNCVAPVCTATGAHMLMCASLNQSLSPENNGTPPCTSPTLNLTVPT